MTHETPPQDERDDKAAAQSPDKPKPDESPRDDMENPPPLPRKRVFFFAIVAVAALLGYGAYKHWQTALAAEKTQAETADFTPEVRTIGAKADESPIDLSLPGQTEPFTTATIFPRATGYIAERKVDIGSRVKKGDLLLRIAAPDLDRQLDQAKAQLEQTKSALAQAQAQLDQAKANLALANITFNRTNNLTQRGYETVQNNDNQRTQVQSQEANVETAQAGIKVADANIKSQQATVDRLMTLTEFERVLAPFDGIVTTRAINVGDLVNADTKTGDPLFTVVDDKVLRVTVHVPQANAVGIKDGLVGEVHLPQLPNRVFTGKIARSSVALQNSARTLDTEVDVDNPDGTLRPGAYVTVVFKLPRARPKVVLPAETLLFNAEGLQVAVVQDGSIHMQTVSILRDYGKTVELRDGLSGGEQVVLNPPTELTEHAKVKVAPKPPQEQAKK